MILLLVGELKGGYIPDRSSHRLCPMIILCRIREAMYCLTVSNGVAFATKSLTKKNVNAESMMVEGEGPWEVLTWHNILRTYTRRLRPKVDNVIRRTDEFVVDDSSV